MQRRVIKAYLQLAGAVVVIYMILKGLESYIQNNGTEQLMRNIPFGPRQLDADVDEVKVSTDLIQNLQEEAQQAQNAQASQHNLQYQEPTQSLVQQTVVSLIADSSSTMNNERSKESFKRLQSQNEAVSGNEGLLSSSQASMPSQRKSPYVGVSTDFNKLNIPLPSLKSKGYILPMLYFDMGPNDLLRLFRQGCVTAYEMGRTAVVPVFHRQPRIGDTVVNPFVLPIFNTNSTVDLVWKPSDTIDMGMLKRAVNTLSMKDFKKDCAGWLDAVVQCGEVDPDRMDGIRHFQRAAGLKIIKEIQVSSYEEFVPNTLKSGSVGPNEYKCLGIIYGKKCLPDQNRWLATFSRIIKNFWRPLPVRKFALAFISEVMENQPYMAVHWRYDSDWLDMCKPSRPEEVRKQNKEICRITIGLSHDQKARTSFLQKLKKKMTQYKLKQIYLSSPPNNTDLIRRMSESFPGKFFYIDDVTKFTFNTEGNSFVTDNYKASLIEQEICFRSTLFLGAPLSSWTQTVLTDRLTRSITRQDSVLNVVGNGSPGIPKLLFQFPEGNSNFEGTNENL